MFTAFIQVSMGPSISLRGPGFDQTSASFVTSTEQLCCLWLWTCQSNTRSLQLAVWVDSDWAPSFAWGGGKRPQFNPSTFVALVRTGLPTRPQCVQDLHKCQRTAQSGRLVLEVTQSLAHDAARTARRWVQPSGFDLRPWPVGHVLMGRGPLESSDTQYLKNIIVADWDPVRLRGSPLYLVDLAIRRVSQDRVFDGSRHLLYVPYQRLVVVTCTMRDRRDHFLLNTSAERYWWVKSDSPAVHTWHEEWGAHAIPFTQARWLFSLATGVHGTRTSKMITYNNKLFGWITSKWNKVPPFIWWNNRYQQIS